MRNRVEIVLFSANGKLVVEELHNPAYPARVGQQRLVGGKIEDGEDAISAAIRELWEEYRWTVSPEELQPICIVEKAGGSVHRLVLPRPVGFDIYSTSGHELLVEVSTLPNPDV